VNGVSRLHGRREPADLPVGVSPLADVRSSDRPRHERHPYAVVGVDLDGTSYRQSGAGKSSGGKRRRDIACASDAELWSMRGTAAGPRRLRASASLSRLCRWACRPTRRGTRPRVWCVHSGAPIAQRLYAAARAISSGGCGSARSLRDPVAAVVSPLARKQAPRELLVRPRGLEREYYRHKPDVDRPTT
jgi:hypothetical protein